ncbi:MAG: CNNM domain-containing protein, partial [Bacillales bacterium]|nr:CNNM domain-containing protein [Bacillales bacterium]
MKILEPDSVHTLAITFRAPQIIMCAVLLFCFVIAAICSLGETSLNSSNLIRIKQYTQSGSKSQRKKARRALKIKEKYAKFLSSVLILNNIVNIAASSITTFIFVDSLKLGGNGVLYSTIIITVIIIVFTELVPKNFANVYPEKILIALSFPLTIISFIFRPLSLLIEVFSKKIEEKAEETEERATATEDELGDLVEQMEKEGELEHSESLLITNSMKFDDTTVHSVMLDKTLVKYVDADSSFKEIVDFFLSIPHTRVPVLKNDKVIGIINQIDCFKIQNNTTLSDNQKKKLVIKPPVYVSYRKSLQFALERSQRNASHLLIVVDNMK